MKQHSDQPHTYRFIHRRR